MRITREWLERTDHCPDGMAFALATLPPEGLELDDCWPLLHRPDWIISLAVQAHHISLNEAREILRGICPYPAEDGYSVGLVLDEACGAAILGDEPKAACLTACAQIIKSYRDEDKALKLLQGAAYSLGQAFGDMRAMAEEIKRDISRRTAGNVL